MDSQTLLKQLNEKQREHEEALKRLKETEDKFMRYRAEAERAYQEVDQMQSQLQNEQRCLETAVRVASRLYSRNTELKKRTVRSRPVAESQRRKAWKEQYDREAFSAASPQREVKNPDPTENDNETNDEKDEENDDSSDDLDAIAKLDKQTKSDLEGIQGDVNTLRKSNREMSTKLSKLEGDQLDGETTIAQLKAVVKMKDEELQALKEKYDVESQVRQRAETYAAKMYGKNKAFQRKSVLLKSRRSDSFDEKLENTMKDLEKMTQELEEEKMLRKQEVQKLEEQLESALSAEGSKVLENKISLLSIEVEQLKADRQRLQEKNSDLEWRIRTQGEAGPPRAPPPSPLASLPPPPPPPPPPSMSTKPQKSEPVQSIYELIAERKAKRLDDDISPGQTRGKSATLPTMTGYGNAMEEMMRRIKSGIALKKSSTLPQAYSTTEIDDTYAYIGDRNGVEEGKSFDESSSENEYDDIYSHVGAAQRGPAPPMAKAATLGGYTSLQPKSAVEKPSGTFNWAGLKPVKKRNKSTVEGALENHVDGSKKEFGKRENSPFSRDSAFQDSVKLPKNINPDLKKMLDRRRIGIKKAQSEAENI